MSALTIALGQTIPIIATAFFTKNKNSTLTVTIIMLILTAFMGKAYFFVMDAIFIGVAYFSCISILKE